MDPQEVMLYPSEQGSPIVLDQQAMWFQRALEDEQITRIEGAFSEDTNWLHLQVKTTNSVQVATPGDYIGIRNDGSLYVRSN